MTDSSDESDRGHIHPDYRHNRHRSRRKPGRLHDYYDYRADLGMSDAAEEDPGSGMLDRSKIRHYEPANSRHHRRYSYSPGPPRERSKSSMRDRSETGYYEQPIPRHHRRHSHSPSPPRERPDSDRRDQSKTRYYEEPVSHYHRRHSYSPRPPREHPKSIMRGRSETRQEERATTRHRPPYSHSAEPPSDRRRHHNNTNTRSNDQHVSNGRLAEKAIATAAATAYRLRNSEGSWVGSKGLKIVGAAVATAAIDGVFDRQPKKHVLRHIAVSMVEGAVMDAFATSSLAGGN